MCGVVGAISNKNISFLNPTIKKMNDLQNHRGPDGEGFWASEGSQVLFGHKRLAIIDLSDSGKQPMTSIDGHYTITYNGEIYNYKELRLVCESRGSIFRSETDTEVIVEYLRHFGVKGIEDFRGMWAFVIFDKKNNTIIMSRDPFGIKPLHYGIKDGVLFFSSEIKSLRAVDHYFNIIDQDTKDIFIEYGYLDFGEWTFFKNVKRFPPASYAIINLALEMSVCPKTYWDPPREQIEISEEQAISTLDQLLEQSVSRHLVSDVPLAFCLSGGLDSSLLVGYASKVDGGKNKINTFTTHYPKYHKIDEKKWANLVVDHCQTHATWVEPTFKEFEAEFKKVLFYHDEPFGSLSIYAQNSIFRSISQSKIKVSIDGQGADEALAGYHSYFYYLFRTLIRQKDFVSLVKESFWLLYRFPNFFFNNFRSIKKLISDKKSNDLLSLSPEAQLRVNRYNKYKSGGLNTNLINSIKYTDIPKLLRNGDRNSMKNSVESRVPFLDVDLINFIITLPNNFKIRKAVTKYILRKVALKYLPSDLVNRKDKMGFPSPEKIWLKKAFNLDVPGPFTKKFRVFLTKKWEEMLEESEVFKV